VIIAVGYFSLQSSSMATVPDSPKRVRTKRYNTTTTSNTPPLDSKATRELSTSAPDLAAEGEEATGLVSCRYSVAGKASADALHFDDLVEEPAEDVDMHIPHSRVEQGGEKKQTQREHGTREDSSSSASEKEDQSDPSL
jgi:hypothetical protein